MAVTKRMATFALAIKQHAYGTLADRLGNGLQNRVEQFDSARYLEILEVNPQDFLVGFLYI